MNITTKQKVLWGLTSRVKAAVVNSNYDFTYMLFRLNKNTSLQIEVYYSNICVKSTMAVKPSQFPNPNSNSFLTEVLHL